MQFSYAQGGERFIFIPGFSFSAFRFHADALALGFFQFFIAGIAFGAHGLNAAGKVPMQAVAAVQLKRRNHGPWSGQVASV